MLLASKAKGQVMAVRASANSGQMSLAQTSSQQHGSLTDTDQIPWTRASPKWQMLRYASCAMHHQLGCQSEKCLAAVCASGA